MEDKAFKAAMNVDTADYIVFAGPNTNEMEPVQAFSSMTSAISFANNLNINNKIITEVVYMPEDDEDTNELVIRFDKVD